MAVLNLGAFSLNPVYLGADARPELFGANFLFNRDGSALTGVDEAYRQFLKEAKVTTLRYPGGTLTETNLDLANPESTNANFMNPFTGQGRTVPLTTFLKLCKDAGTSATIVLPTYRFLNETPDASGHRQIDTGEKENLRAFVRFAIVKAQEIGVKLAAFEIGNEWHVDNSNVFGFRMSPIEYGRIANYISAIVQKEIDNLKSSGISASTSEPAIVIQVGPGAEKELYTTSGFRPGDGYAGPTVTATQLIAQQFTDLYARKAVDGVLKHRYMTVSDERAGEWVYNPFKTWSAVTAGMGGFQSVDQYVTEWNVSARNTNERGLAQFDSMFEMLREMLLAGVDHANVWAVQQNNRTRMIDNTGNDGAQYGGLTYGGLAFDIASAQMRNLKALKAPESVSGISINAFGSPDRSVMVLTNRTDSDVNHTVDLAKIIKFGHHVTMYRIGEAIDRKPTVHVTTLTIQSTSQKLSLNFNEQESIVIVVAARQSGSTIEGYDQNDLLTGSALADSILAGDGNDTCRGGSGGDFIYGEEGHDTLLGGEGNDTLDGGSGRDILDGGSGDDIIFWSPGGDTLNGGPGVDILSFERQDSAVVLNLASQDSLTSLLGGAVLAGIEGFAGGSYDDVLLGGQFDDLLFGGNGDDFLLGSNGNDRLFGELGTDTIFGEVGNDSLYGGAANDLLDGGDGSDLIEAGDGADVVFGNRGNDTLNGGADADTLDGGSGDDRILAGDGDDSVAGDVGSDFLLGDAGADLLYSGDGQDSVFGGSGRDTVWGDFGNDLLDGGDDVDRISGGDGNDRVLGGRGDDFLFGGGHRDTIEGGAGNDMLHGEDGADRLICGDGLDNGYGGAGDDTVFGGNGRDVLFGNEGNDLVYGDGDNDHIIGGLGNDTLYGGSGDDLLVDQVGTNLLYGGQGADIFAFVDSVGSSRVMDFANNVDTLLFRGNLLTEGMTVTQFVDTYARRTGNTIVFDFGDKGSLTVSGLSAVSQLYDDVTLLW